MHTRQQLKAPTNCNVMQNVTVLFLLACDPSNTHPAPYSLRPCAEESEERSSLDASLPCVCPKNDNVRLSILLIKHITLYIHKFHWCFYMKVTNIIIIVIPCICLGTCFVNFFDFHLTIFNITVPLSQLNNIERTTNEHIFFEGPKGTKKEVQRLLFYLF